MIDVDDLLDAIDDKDFFILYEHIDRFVEQIQNDETGWKRLKTKVRQHVKSDQDLPRVGEVDEWAQEVADRARQQKYESGDDGPFSAPFYVGDAAELSRRLEKVLVDDPDNLVFDHGRIHRFDEKSSLWEPIAKAELSTLVQEFSGADNLGVMNDGPPPPLKITKSRAAGAIEFLEDRQDESARRDGELGFFDDAPRGVMFTNTFLRADLDADEIVPKEPDRTHRARTGFEFDYYPNARAPRFDRYLDEIFEGDDDADEKRRMLLEFAGACLFEFADDKQKALVLYDDTDGGQGANGKSVFIKVLESVFPTGAVSSLAPQDFGHRFKSAVLAGKKLNVITEMPESDIVAGDAFKGIITGDPITREFKNQDPFSFRPRAGHLFACNTFPAVQDTSGAFWRRLLVVPFGNRFTGEDAEDGLEDRLVGDELPGIVARIVKGAKRLLERGEYTIPESCERAHQRWKREANPVYQFLRDEVESVADGDHWTSASDVYAAYKAWTEFWGFGQMSRTKFGRRLVEFVDKKRSGGSKYHVKLKEKRNRAAGRLDPVNSFS